MEDVRVKILDIPTTIIEIQKGQEWLINMINILVFKFMKNIHIQIFHHRIIKNSIIQH